MKNKVYMLVLRRWVHREGKLSTVGHTPKRGGTRKCGQRPESPPGLQSDLGAIDCDIIRAIV